jgi:signal transduction histidine kinase
MADLNDRIADASHDGRAERSPEPGGAATARHAPRRLAVAALAAELGHQLQGPLNLFRLSAERLAQGDVLDQEDLTLLGEELARMSRLSGRLRELARVSGPQSACTPRELTALALVELGAELEIDVGDDVSLVCDPVLLGHALRELCENALEAKASRAGVRFDASAGFCVWDDGPGLSLGAERSLAWGETTRPCAAGLGLSVALRAARAHGFDLELRRSAERTEAWVLVPARALTRVAP